MPWNAIATGSDAVGNLAERDRQMASPESKELIQRAAALREQLWAEADEADRRSQLTETVLEAVVGAGLTRLMTPRAYGGHGTDLATLLEVCVELGAGCCSTSWYVGVISAGNFVVSLFPREAQDEVFGAEPGARTALVLGRPSGAVREVPGGLSVSGEWHYVSGCLHAEWISVLVAQENAGAAPAVWFALLPAAEVEIERTWRFTGMRGTGSHTVKAADVFVPRHRLLPYGPVLAGQTDGLVDPVHRYRNSLTGLFGIGLTGSFIGGARGALEFVQGQAAKRPVAGSRYRAQEDSPTFQLDLADAATRIDGAVLHARRITATVEEHAVQGRNADLLTRARTRMDSTRAAQLSRQAVDVLMTAYGSSAFHEASPLQRIWRDVNVGTRHAGFGMGIPQQVYGRALVGADPREISPLV